MGESEGLWEISSGCAAPREAGPEQAWLSRWGGGVHIPLWDPQPWRLHPHQSEGTSSGIPHQEESRPGRPGATGSLVPKREAEVGLVGPGAGARMFADRGQK